jgi:glycosyltransferase involved in cell wall biosynthesis
MLVSIIIPRLKGRRTDWFKETVKSVERQMYPNIELIIEESEQDETTNTRNGIKKAKGDIIHILHDDDILFEHSVKVAVEHIKDYDFIHGIAHEIKEDFRDTYNDLGYEESVRRYIPPIKTPTLEQLKDGNILHFATIYYRKEALDAVGFDGDYMTSLKLLKKGFKLGYCPYPLAYYRIHAGQVSQSKEWKQTMKERRQQILTKIDQYQ